MGSIKKALKPVTRVVDDIIPNEIKPALPYLAATFGAPYLAPAFGSLGGTGIMGAALRKGLAGAVTNLGTQVALGKNVNPVSAAVSGLFAGAGPALAGKGEFAESLGSFISPDKVGGMTLGQAATAASVPITAGTAEAAYDAAKEAEDAYEEYLKQQEAAGNEDIQTRVDFISRYLANAGFDQDYIDTRLNELGYAANGGLMGTRVGFEEGGEITLGDKMGDLNIALKRDEIIRSGKLGFDVKDIFEKTDEQIIEIHKSLFGTGKAYGGRIGYRIGGGPVKSFIAKLLGAEPSEEVLNKMFEERKNEIFNEMFDPEAGTGAYSMQQMQEASDMATKQAMQELEEFKMRIGMEMKNPPEGSVGDDVIDQIMEPRKEGRVKEAYGGRIGLKEGGTGDVLFDTYRDPFSELIGYPSYVLRNESKFLNNLLEDPDDLSMKEIKAQMKSENAPIAKYLKRLPKEQRKEALRLLRDKYADLGEYYKPEEEKYLEKRGYMADGGIMNLKMGGMPAEMDLRGGGFVPLGAKEKADDVPARLSKNEFVMTADAVRAAGGGSVNKGAKKMYDLMNKLEARV